MASRRVVVTGVGAVSPLGLGARENWAKVIKGDGGRLGWWKEYYAGQLDEKGEEAVKAKTSGAVSRFAAMALVAAEEAVADAGDVFNQKNDEEYGCAVGSGIGGLDAVLEETRRMPRVSPYMVPRLLANSAAGAVSREFDLRGPCLTPAGACAAGAQAIGDAFGLIKNGEADVMLAGGSEAAVYELALAGFSRARALASGFDDPQDASRPFDAARNGFVLSEGAAILVLENAERALERGKRPYCEIVGYGQSADAYHATAPREDGASAVKAMLNALNGRVPHYVNAHAASTPKGDLAEAFAISKLPGRPLVSSTKGATGHLLGAAGAIEALFTALAVFHRLAPPTRNLVTPLTDDLDFVLSTTHSLPHNAIALSNSFGFSGVNSSLCFRSWSSSS